MRFLSNNERQSLGLMLLVAALVNIVGFVVASGSLYTKGQAQSKWYIVGSLAVIVVSFLTMLFGRKLILERLTVGDFSEAADEERENVARARRNIDLIGMRYLRFSEMGPWRKLLYIAAMVFCLGFSVYGLLGIFGVVMEEFIVRTADGTQILVPRWLIGLIFIAASNALAVGMHFVLTTHFFEKWGKNVVPFRRPPASTPKV